MRLFSLLLCLFLSGLTTEALASGCFTRHLEEAIVSNKARRDVYARLTAGESVELSNALIRSERLTVAAARYFDWRARHFENAGVPVLCEGFIEMSATPPVQSAPLENPDPIERFVSADSGRITRELRAALAEGGIAGVYEAAKAEIVRLKSPTYNCMLRHGLESIARFAWLAPKHERLALEKGLSSPAGLSRRLIQAHILGIGTLVELDDKASVFQARGIAIICRDVPPIPYE